MGKEWKTIEEHEKRLKAIEESLGISQGAKNIHMLLDTITVQGNVEHQLRDKMKGMQEMVQSVLAQRTEFLKENKLEEKFTEWANKKAADAKIEVEAKKAAEEAAKREAAPLTQHTAPKTPVADERELVKEADGMIKSAPKKQIVTEDKSKDAEQAITDSKKEVVNDGVPK
jgi:hypothetical protein